MFDDYDLPNALKIKQASSAQVEPSQSKLAAIIADEDTVVGFLLGGIGEINHKGKRNFFVIEKDTTPHDIEEIFEEFTTRKDIAVVLITREASNEIHYVTDNYVKNPPIVIIPGHSGPFEVSFPKSVAQIAENRASNWTPASLNLNRTSRSLNYPKK